mgnify:FL=1|jgi:hypothetical protein|tara:strand:- start:1433 stop:2338 length:906 start_codon:yes stop_codon:yes gene_type:complete
MAWIKSEQELASHPKLLMLAQDLEIGVPQTVGHLHLLWWWALDYCEDGYLTKYRNFIPLSAQFMGDGDFFTKKLIEHGWIDEIGDDLVIHDWMDYTGNLITVREKDRERKRKARTSENSKNSTNKESWEISDNVNKTNKNVPRTSTGHPSDIQAPSDVRGEEKRVEESRGDIVPTEQVEFIHQDVGVVQLDNIQKSTTHSAVFVALCQIFGFKTEDLTQSSRGMLNKVAKELSQVGANAYDIEARIRNYALTYGNKPTPTALAKHWPDLAQANPKLSKKDLEKLQKKLQSQASMTQWLNEK